MKILIWLSIAAWLYQAAVQSGMNGLLCLAAGLAGNACGKELHKKEQ